MTDLLEETSRMRMFAGPNGSGKSTMKSVIKPNLLGFYINPDEIEVEIAQYGFLDIGRFRIKTDKTEILEFFQTSTLLEKADLLDEAEVLKFNDNKLGFFEVGVNAYFASVAADFIRQKLILSGQSFTFETVMSSPDKVKLLENARQRGYRTYLYYVATDDPIINISRVRHRVKSGGHDVPTEKITSRYYRSLDLLSEAIKLTNRSYIFDNSGSNLLWLAEITEAKSIELKTENITPWFKTYVLDKFEFRK